MLRRITATRVLLALVVIGPIATLVLWWLGTLPDHFHPEVGREDFGNIPGAVIALFYIGVAAAIGVMAYLFAIRAKNWERGASESRSGNWGKRFIEFWRGVSMRSVMEDPVAGIMHSMIYFGFLVLAAGTATVEINHLAPNNLKFIEGGFYQGFSFVLDIAAIVFVAGVLWAMIRRYGAPPWRIRSKTRLNISRRLGGSVLGSSPSSRRRSSTLNASAAFAAR